MIFYLTFNDTPSGIFSGQVVDVVKFLNTNFQNKVQLISFVSGRRYFKFRAEIKQQLPDAIVLPMMPGVGRWRLNVFVLYVLAIFKRPKKIIGRSVLATQLALKIRNKGIVKEIVYDGRGAISAEWKEYKVIKEPKMLSEIFNLEKEVVLKSDYRIAVSHKLVEYWQNTYGYRSNHHVIIPCTLNKLFEEVEVTEFRISEIRKSIGFNESDIVFVYSGSVAGWQSFEILYDYMSPILKSGANYKMMFLSDVDKNILKLQNQFPHQVICMKLKVSEVPEYLLSADYGLLLREETITNKVASPVKFAEYVACGLRVIISDNLGDYSALTVNNKWGFLQSSFPTFAKPGYYQKSKLRAEALNYFVKEKYVSQYHSVLNNEP